MIHIKNSSDTILILLHEIYGVNHHILNVCQRFGKEKYDVVCPNLLANRQTPFSYSQEMTAYQYFMQNVGFHRAQQRVEEITLQIRAKYRKCFIIGYSIGATIAWLCSQHEDLYNGAVGFYGSRIRDYKKVEPKCPTLLFFPKLEENFDVDGLMRELSGKSNVSSVKVNALHGFADPWSNKYCQEESEKMYGKMLDFIQKIKREN